MKAKGARPNSLTNSVFPYRLVRVLAPLKDVRSALTENRTSNRGIIKAPNRTHRSEVRARLISRCSMNNKKTVRLNSAGIRCILFHLLPCNFVNLTECQRGCKAKFAQNCFQCVLDWSAFSQLADNLCITAFGINVLVKLVRRRQSVGAIIFDLFVLSFLIFAHSLSPLPLYRGTRRSLIERTTIQYYVVDNCRPFLPGNLLGSLLKRVVQSFSNWKFQFL